MTYRIGEIIKGKITGIQPYGAFVSLDEETQGLIHVSEVQSGYTKSIHTLLKVGQPVTVQIIDIDEYSNKISLSLRTLEKKVPSIPYRRKRYFTNKNKKIGFATIEKQLPIWIKEALIQLDKKESRK
ncbi:MULTISPECIES: CvfD/Ygs/GSP13 family RNA-binding post-transcriptional regulator [Enterococcus]|uniref:General stress protein n=1 Tax=Enterococcus mundtii TaxID=53346 RepID=A0A1A6GAY7_ENTMU|nr:MULTISPECIES: CvfD/Ygs/GSP13 family RNA-binding post-transcriptional regulator [Enterococcus]MBE6172717.1 S1 RNA-binding domain-containing protein [Enterococcus faecium]MBE9911514.1 S1 RNA-binding domain-containing protein [Enterococcus mundtii]MBO1086720.1 S1 RNA-binding domain-containing protein [Enterococcus mundtii]MCA6774372.1 S1 RNA-binding domain-containing protein [Enterococcus mundtii]MDA9461159.1 General stress protein 13 [Enterococcus mundtii 3F]